MNMAMLKSDRYNPPLTLQQSNTSDKHQESDDLSRRSLQAGAMQKSSTVADDEIDP